MRKNKTLDVVRQKESGMVRQRLAQVVTLDIFVELRLFLQTNPTEECGNLFLLLGEDKALAVAYTIEHIPPEKTVKGSTSHTGFPVRQFFKLLQHGFDASCISHFPDGPEIRASRNGHLPGCSRRKDADRSMSRRNTFGYGAAQAFLGTGASIVQTKGIILGEQGVIEIG